MIQSRLYLETSVVSYLIARPSRDVVVLAHQQITRDFWEKRLGRFEVFISQIVLEEASRGDRGAAKSRLDLISPFPLLPVTLEVDRLAELYLREKVIPPVAIRDAYHIALASVHEMDYLLTWNCRHIASGEVRRRLAELHRREDIFPLVICTPEELAEDE